MVSRVRSAAAMLLVAVAGVGLVGVGAGCSESRDGGAGENPAKPRFDRPVEIFRSASRMIYGFPSWIVADPDRVFLAIIRMDVDWHGVVSVSATPVWGHGGGTTPASALDELLHGFYAKPDGVVANREIVVAGREGGEDVLVRTDGSRVEVLARESVTGFLCANGHDVYTATSRSVMRYDWYAREEPEVILGADEMPSDRAPIVAVDEQGRLILVSVRLSTEMEVWRRSGDTFELVTGFEVTPSYLQQGFFAGGYMYVHTNSGVFPDDMRPFGSSIRSIDLTTGDTRVLSYTRSTRVSLAVDSERAYWSVEGDPDEPGSGYIESVHHGSDTEVEKLVGGLSYVYPIAAAGDGTIVWADRDIEDLGVMRIMRLDVDAREQDAHP